MMAFAKHAAQRPVREGLNDKFTEIKARLKKLQAEGPEVGGEGATLGDDAPLPADKRAAIAREETVVRKALKVVGVDYDALIAQEGQEGRSSAYAQAVAANPAILKQVLASDSPVVAALEVAMGYKPYAEFTAKYGKEPAAIKEAIRAELLAEGGAEAPAAAAPKPSAELPFARRRAAGAGQGGAAVQATGLATVFRK